MAICVGIDENGLGPRLGPLIVTSVTARTDGAGEKRAESRPRGKLAERLGDSKKLVAFGDSALGEAWARALAARLSLACRTPDDLVHALAIDSREALQTTCPAEPVGAHSALGARAQCWGVQGETFEADVALVGAVAADLEKLASLGVDVLGVRVAIVCTERLNAAALRGLSRFHVDLHAMERLALASRAASDTDLVVTCGKVGGFNRYAPHFGPLNGRLHTVVVEGRARSEYAIPGLGRLAFVRDADDRHLLVCMASLVGKWVRDLLMQRIVRHHRDANPELPVASGYHDPVTARFIDASALTRKRHALPDTCFERTRVAPLD